ncbi:MAG: bifunctional precorrin-2 dehydrogenase/sirohydrochlorin ferrochelatase, partial [Candidatus Kapaibacteriota bacterium]
EVATRKVQNLLNFNARPKVIAPETTQKLEGIIHLYNLEYEKRKYVYGDLQGFRLVFVATDDPVLDSLVKEEAEKSGAIVNFADQPEMCNFIVPSYIKRGDLVISISTQGKAPFLSKWLREMLDKKFPSKYKGFVDLAVHFRTQFKEKKISGRIKDKIIDEFLAIRWLEILEDDGIEYAKLLVNNLVDYYARKK